MYFKQIVIFLKSFLYFFNYPEFLLFEQNCNLWLNLIFSDSIKNICFVQIQLFSKTIKAFYNFLHKLFFWKCFWNHSQASLYNIFIVFFYFLKFFVVVQGCMNYLSACFARLQIEKNFRHRNVFITVFVIQWAWMRMIFLLYCPAKDISCCGRKLF